MRFLKHKMRGLKLVLAAGLTFGLFQNCSFPIASPQDIISTSSSSMASTSANDSVSVDSYGAKADGVTDSTDAFKSAINAVVQSSGAIKKIILSEGTYYLSCPAPAGVKALSQLTWPLATSASVSAQPETFCLTVASAKAFSLVGQGSAKTQLLLGNPVSGLINVSSSVDISFSGFSIDYKDLPFSQGVIQNISTTGNYVDVTVDSGYSGLDAVKFSSKYFPNTFMVVLESALPRLKQTTKGFFANYFASKNANGSYRLQLDSGDNWALPGISAGDRFILPTRVSSILSFYRNTNVALQDVALYSGPGAAVIAAENAGEFSVKSVQIRRKPGTTRLVSVAADAFHFANNSARISIYNSHIEGMADDAINIYTTCQADGNPGSNAVSYQALIANNTFGMFRGYLRIRSPGAVLRNNSFADAINAKVLVDFDPSYKEGPSLIRDPLYMVTNVANTASGGSFDLIDIQLKSLSADLQTRSLYLNTLLFNPTIYRALNPDLAGYSDTDIAVHWVNYGVKEGRQANLYFSPRDYLDVYKDLSGSYAYAAEHFLLYGNVLEKRTGVIFTHPTIFNIATYRSANPDIAAMSDAQLVYHWLYHGMMEGRQASTSFYSRTYLTQHPDLIAKYGKTAYDKAIEHYLLGAVLAR